VYLEVVDFWTPEYLERKSKLNSIAAGIDMVCNRRWVLKLSE